MADPIARWRRILETLLGNAATEGNRIRVLRDGVEIFPAMLEAIERSEHTVDLLTFVYWKGEIARRFADVLEDRAAAGVRCRVILDAFGARHVDMDLIEEMQDAGVLLHWFHPMTNRDWPGHRTHRKVLICDEQLAFTGGVGIAEEWDGSSDDASAWRETQIQVRGPAVDGLRAAFVDDWFEAEYPLFDDRDRFPEQPTDGPTTAMVVRGAAEHGWNDIALLRHALLASAEERVRMTTAYLAPDPRTLATIRETCARGVTVQLIVAGPQTDKEVARLAAERVYEDLLEVGVELYEFQPTNLHAKVMTVDRKLAVVGSANLNTRSLRHDGEVDVVMFDPKVVAVLDEHTDHDLSRSERIEPGEARDRSPVRFVPRALTKLVDGWA